ncbi:MAG: metal-binding heat shock protein [Rickettsiaceae bacterium]|jgi:probable rRNA maturation factor|nr:metal-binding heat shock protein [Rickettsiaceae bacterium]
MNIEPILLQNYDKWLFYQEEINPNQVKNILYSVFDNIELFPENVTVELCLALESDIEIQRLNKEFRHKNKPTNVLSFPLHELTAGQNIENHIVGGHIYLGDIVFAFETIEREVEFQQKTFMNHFTHLLVHSTLHLLGYDHEEGTDAEIMEALEVKILSNLNIPSPYII